MKKPIAPHMELMPFTKVASYRNLLCILFFFNAFSAIGQIDPCDDPNAFGFEIESISGEQGELVCARILARNFINVGTIQLSLNFDPSVLSYEDCVSPTDLVGFDCSSGSGVNLMNVDNGWIGLIWFDLNLGLTLPDGSELFHLCFEITGTPTSSTFFTISNDPIPIEVVVDANDINSTIFYSDDICIEAGDVSVECSNLGFYETVCPADPVTGMGGSISLYSCGGTPNYSYTINGVPYPGTFMDNEILDLTNQSAGAYTIEVTDNLGNTFNKVINLVSTAPITIAYTSEDPRCALLPENRHDGSIDITVTGGIAPYFYRWADFPISTNERGDLPNGNYSVTVEDANGCTATEMISLFRDTIKIDASFISAVDCDRNSALPSLGSIEISLSGGQPFPGDEYNICSFNIDAFVQNENPTRYASGAALGLQMGNNFIIAKDNAPGGCTSDTLFYNMPVGKILVGEISNFQPIQCFGDSTASFMFELSAIGGVPRTDIRLNLTNNDGYDSQNIVSRDLEESFEDLPAGEYRLTARDFTGCFWDTLFVIETPLEIVLDSIDFTAPDCDNGGTGSVEILATGGSGTFTYMWTDGMSGTTRTDITAGTYTAVATDTDGCTDTLILIIPNIMGGLEIDTVITTDVTCDAIMGGTMGGSITINIINPSGEPVTFDWGEGPILNENSRSDLPLDTYTIIVSNGMGCDITVIEEVVSPVAFTPSTNQTFGACQGDSADVFISVLPAIPGGYSFDWTHPNNDGTNRLRNVPPGTYEVSITDPGSGCTEIYQAILNDQPAIELSIDNSTIQDASCGGMADGRVIAVASGGPNGATSFNFEWSSMETGLGATHQAAFLQPGENWVVVDDFTCESDTLFFMINAGPSPVLDLDNSVFTNPTCFGDNNGSIDVVATGSGGGYTYSWPDLIRAGNSVTGLPAGEHRLLIRDMDNCTTMDTILLTEPDELIAVIDPAQTADLSCNGNATGRIAVLATGGNDMNYDYTWTDNVSTTAIASNLDEGIYMVTVSDFNNCSTVESYTLLAPTAISADIPVPAEIVCFNGQTGITVNSATGGTGIGYTYSITTGGLQVPLGDTLFVGEGTYNLSVFDNSGCPFDTTIVITQPSEFVINAGTDQEIRLGNPVSINVDPANFVDGLSDISWTASDGIFSCVDPDRCFEITATPVINTTYTVIATDNDGCIAEAIVEVTIDNTRGVYFPNAFAPDGNTSPNNDTFGIGVNGDVQTVNMLEIYDRWGNIVYAIGNTPYTANVNDMIGSWDGSHNGVDLPDGVYQMVTSITFLDGITQNYRQSIHLIR